MFEKFKDFLESLDLSDIKLIVLGCVLLVLPLLYLFWFSGMHEDTSPARRISITDMGRQSAFNLTSTAKTTSSAPSKTSLAVAPRSEQLESELDKAWQKIQAAPKLRSIPSDVPLETRQMIEAEDDPYLSEGNSLLDRCDFAAAEKSFLAAIDSAGSNHFKELYAWGGLMEIHQLNGDKAKFREAFANYAKTAQKLQHVYGPLADNVARAYQMFEQLSKIDSGKVREYLTRENLMSGNNISFEDFMKSVNQTREWFPSDLPAPAVSMPPMMQHGSGG